MEFFKEYVVFIEIHVRYIVGGKQHLQPYQNWVDIDNLILSQMWHFFWPPPRIDSNVRLLVYFIDIAR